MAGIRGRSGTEERRLFGAVTVVVAFATAALTLLGAAVLVGGARHDGRTSRHGLQTLPPAARGPVASALGRGDRAYWVRGLSGRNPVQRLRVGFTDVGVTVASGRGRVGLSLAAFGRAGMPRPVDAASPRVSANRISYDHGSVREWYSNGPLGLEQGFDLATRPAGGSAPVTLALGLSGNLAARLDRGSVLFSGDGARLRYTGLAASDAHGRPLHSWLALSAGRLELRLDDRGASYPVRVDPFIQQAELTASDAAVSDELGYSAAVSGDTIVAGAPSRNGSRGAAYVFVKPAGGWANATQTAELTASDGVAGDFLGYSVAVSGDTIVAGAPRRHGNAGTGYVFVKPAGGWADATQTAELTPSDVANTTYPEDSVAVSGDTIVVGLPGFSTGQGAAYVYVKPASGWIDATQTAELTASDGAANELLGTGVGVSGDSVVAGAPDHNGNKGAAYVFVKPPGGWVNATQTSELTASDGATNDRFGSSVAISASTVVAGSDRTVGANPNQGAAYVFVMPAGGWPASATQTSELTASDGAANDFLGYPVAISGNTVVAGAEGRNSEQGAAYVFVMPPGGWPAGATQTGELTASDGVVGDGFGIGVGISGNTVVASAQYRDSSRGAAYAFARPGPSVSIDSPQSDATYTPGQVVNAAFSCSDAADGSGLASCSGTTANGSPVDTSTLGAHTFTVTAADNAGQQTSQSVSYTVAATPLVTPIPVATPTPRPLVSGARQSHKRWRLGTRLARITRSRRPVGTRFSFRLNETARVRLAFTQRVAGRRVGGRCVAPNKRNRLKRKCTRIITTGTLSFNGHTGLNAVSFQGRLSRHKKLRPGRYTVVITATNVGGRSKPVHLTFTIVAR